MLPPSVRRIGCLKPVPDKPANFAGTVATFMNPDGVPVHIVDDTGAPEKHLLAPDYRGRWGKAPILYGRRVVHPYVDFRMSFVMFADAPDLPRPFKFVCIEEHAQRDHYEVWWWRGLDLENDFKALTEQIAIYFFSED